MGGPNEKFNICIEILSCRGILIGDDTGFSDPYLKIKLGKKDIHQTKYVEQTLTPVYTEELDNTFAFQCSRQELDKNGGLLIKIKDWDLIGSDDLGTTVVPTSTLLQMSNAPLECKFTPPKSRRKENAGFVKLRIRPATPQDLIKYKPKLGGVKGFVSKTRTSVLGATSNNNEQVNGDDDAPQKQGALGTISTIGSVGMGIGMGVGMSVLEGANKHVDVFKKKKKSVSNVVAQEQIKELDEDKVNNSNDNENDIGINKEGIKDDRTECTEPQQSDSEEFEVLDENHLRFCIEIISCSGLLAADDTGKSDPYVKIKFGRKELHQTKYIEQTLDPVYDPAIHDSLFCMQCSKNELVNAGGLRLKIKDYDLIGSDDDLGDVVIGADKILELLNKRDNSPVNCKIIPPKSRKKEGAGILRFRCRMGSAEDAKKYGVKSFFDNVQKNAIGGALVSGVTRGLTVGTDVASFGGKMMTSTAVGASVANAGVGIASGATNKFGQAVNIVGKVTVDVGGKLADVPIAGELGKKISVAGGKVSDAGNRVSVAGDGLKELKLAKSLEEEKKDEDGDGERELDDEEKEVETDEAAEGETEEVEEEEEEEPEPPVDPLILEPVPCWLTLGGTNKAIITGEDLTKTQELLTSAFTQDPNIRWVELNNLKLSEASDDFRLGKALKAYGDNIQQLCLYDVSVLCSINVNPPVLEALSELKNLEQLEIRMRDKQELSYPFLINFLENSNVKSLVLWNVLFDISKLENVYEAFTGNQKIERFELWKSDAGSKEGERFAEITGQMLKFNSTIQEMVISHVGLQAKDCSLIADGLETNTTLQKLALLNVLGAENTLAVLLRLKTKCLKNLTITFDESNNEGLVQLFHQLQRNSLMRKPVINEYADDVSTSGWCSIL